MSKPKFDLHQNDLINAFCDYLRYEKNASPKTAEHYTRDLKQFQAFAQTRQANNWLDINEKLAQAWSAHLHTGGCSGRSIARKLSSVRALYRYMQKNEWHDQNPAQWVKAPKHPDALPAVLSVDQMQAVLTQKTTTALDKRDLALLELAYASGLRVSELHQLNLSDFNQKSTQIRVIGKGQREREVPVGDYALKALSAWLNEREKWTTQDEEAVFLSKRGKRLSIRQIQTRFKHWGQRLGSTHLHPHLFRHAFATHILESSGDLRAVQALLGHQDIKTTQIYTRLDIQALSDVYDRAHPKA